MNVANKYQCTCFENAGAARENYALTFLGVDETEGRFAEVEIGHCGRCFRYWLHYQWEVEGFSHSGRRYRTPITWLQSQNLTPETAAALLENADWYFVGGSYFGGSVHRSAGPLR